jgi:hypothetical protein
MLYTLCSLFFGTELFALLESTLEVRVGAFFPSSKLYREIYGDILADYQIEGVCRVRGPFSVFGNVDFISTDGNSICKGNKTSLGNLNVSSGLEYEYSLFYKLTLFVGIGPNLSWIWLNNHSPCGHERIVKCGFGGVAKSSVRYWFQNHLFFDFFVDYLYQPIHFQKTQNIGGFKAGLGLGWHF